MNALNTKKNRMLGFIMVVSILAWQVPATAMSATNPIEFTGTLLPAEKQHAPNVYTLQYGDQRWYLGVSRVKTSINHSWSEFTEWTELRRSGFKKWRLIRNKKIAELLNTPKVCEAVRISGFINYSTGRLTVLDVKPLKKEVESKWCKS